MNLLPLLLASSLLFSVSTREVELRNLGLSQLEDEKPSDAEATYRKLAKLVPEDPLPQANLAIALLRQQKHQEAIAAIDEALELAPNRPDLLAIRAAALTWSGGQEQALDDLVIAGDAAPEDPEVQYALYRQAVTVGGEKGDAAAATSLTRLVRLRPENVVVLLQLGQRAIAESRRDTASRAYLRLQELAWQAPKAANKVLDGILAALEADDLEAARIPALRLENVFKITAMYQQSLRELNTGILGVPVTKLQGEPAPTAFGKPLDLRFQAGESFAENASPLAVGDFDGDGRTDLAYLQGDGAQSRLGMRLSGGDSAPAFPAAGATGLLPFDLDNDGRLDLLGYGSEGATFWQNSPDGWKEATAAFGLDTASGTSAAAVDFDIEGDVDLIVGGSSVQVFRNALQGPLEAVGDRVFPALGDGETLAAAVASDFDRDGDLDLLFAGSAGVTIFDNLRQGRFERVEKTGIAGEDAVDLESVDLDDDGLPDLALLTADGLSLWKNRGPVYGPWPQALPSDLGSAGWRNLAALDADNDGRLDLALAGEAGVTVLQNLGTQLRSVSVATTAARDVAAADLDGDGDLDLAASSSDGVRLFLNQVGSDHRYVELRLRGLDKGSSKNNILGLGSTVEVFTGTAYQFREMQSDFLHLGIGEQSEAEVLRIVWTNGVPQNRVELAGNQRVVEEQLLKGSCPFVYAWNGESFEFVTDLLWGAPLGMPVAAGVWAGADPSELVRLDGLARDGDRYRLRVTEELWEAAYFDRVRLVVVDHPAEAEVASNLRILVEPLPTDEVLTSLDLRAPQAAWDGRGDAVTEAIIERDEVYAAGFDRSAYQGIAAGDWTFTFDLGEAPAAPIRLHLDGWVFPADASLNLAVAQRSELPPAPTRLEVETAAGWQTLVDPMGFPAGKTKTMVVDTPPLPEGARRLRIVTRRWLAWDRIAWTTEAADDLSQVRARLTPDHAELRYRGFSEMTRKAPNAPHHYDYASVSRQSPWLAFPGRYTRYGDVLELLESQDDRLAILAPGDEIDLVFDASVLPDPRPGWKRTLFLESVGWDKDADRNTWAAERMEPLPFHGMGGYPYPEGVSYPEREDLRRYRADWLTREVEAATGKRSRDR